MKMLLVASVMNCGIFVHAPVFKRAAKIEQPASKNQIPAEQASSTPDNKAIEQNDKKKTKSSETVKASDASTQTDTSTAEKPDDYSMVIARVFNETITTAELDRALGIYIQRRGIEVKSEEDLAKIRPEALKELILCKLIRALNPSMANDPMVQLLCTQIIADLYADKQSKELANDKALLEKYYREVYLAKLDLPPLYSVMSCSFETEAQAKAIIAMLTEGKSIEVALASLNKSKETKSEIKYAFKDIDVRHNEDGYSSSTIGNLNTDKAIISALFHYKTPIAKTVHPSVITLKAKASSKKNTPYAVVYIKEITIGDIDDFPAYNHDKIGPTLAREYIHQQLQSQVDEYKKDGSIEIYNTKKTQELSK